MSRRVSIYFIFLFYYTCNGQIVLAPIQEQIANDTSKLKQKLNGVQTNLQGSMDGSMLALKAKLPYERKMSSQWVLDAPVEHYHGPVGEVRYYIDDDTYGDGVSELLIMAFDLIRVAVDFQCPRFVPVTEKPIDGDWLHFTNPDRVRPCVHEPAINKGGEIIIVLGYDCLKPREVLHTVLHGFGFRDEITHPKRDLFVRVLWENIQPAFRFMFSIQSMDTSDQLSEYDPMSIMHFHDREYSVNGQPTVMPVLPGLKIEPSDQLSHHDKVKLRRIFGKECTRLQYGNIMNKCGNNVELDLISDNANNAGPCYNGGKGDQIVVHGHDVQPGGGNGGGGMVIPGHDVQLNSDDEKLVVVGNDVKALQAHKNDEGVADEESYNSLGGSKGAQAQKQKKLLGSGGGFEVPDDEAIIVGYNVESKHKLSKFKKMKQKKLFGGVGGAGFDVPSDEAIVAGYLAKPERQ